MPVTDGHLHQCAQWDKNEKEKKKKEKSFETRDRTTHNFLCAPPGNSNRKGGGEAFRRYNC